MYTDPKFRLVEVESKIANVLEHLVHRVMVVCHKCHYIEDLLFTRNPMNMPKGS